MQIRPLKQAPDYPKSVLSLAPLGALLPEGDRAPCHLMTRRRRP
ncbi:hypothetical protein C7S13_6864 [Burkholderia cepacia]|nr:hypothetical protein [Burkholderia cepacia]